MDTQLNEPKPHYLLFFETAWANNPGRWRFVLKEANGISEFQAADVEPDISGERLDLLTIIRALESLDQPSRVTLTSCSPYIHQGIQYNLFEWRTNKWQWEFFGYMVPIKHADLWRRMDHLLNVHSVECRWQRFDRPHHRLTGPKTRQRFQPASWGLRVAAEIWLKCAVRIIPQTLRHRLSMALNTLRRGCIDLSPTSKPCPGSG